jgi:pimeloyl-ACP methyl ester carboxylesterase
VLVVPGAWTTADAFDDVRDDVERHGYRVRIIDLPARSRRVPQLDRGGLGAIDRALDEAIESCGAAPILVGHSLGGLASLRAGRRHALAALVLLMPAPPAGLARTMLAGAVRRPVHTAALLGAALSIRTATRLSSIRPAGMYSAQATPETLRRAAAYRTDESWSVLAALLLGSREAVTPSGSPTLVVGGSQDLVTPAPIVARLAAELKAEYVELDVAHAFNEEPTFTTVTEAVLRFLDTHVDAPAGRAGDDGGTDASSRTTAPSS